MFKRVFSYFSVIAALAVLSANSYGFVDKEWFNAFTPSYIKGNQGDVKFKKTLFSKNNQDELQLGGTPFYNFSFGNNTNSLASTEISLRIASANTDLFDKVSKVRIHSLFFNGYLTEKVSEKLVPYFMYGVGGYGSSRSNMIGSKTSGNALYDIGIGTFVKITDHLLIDLNYKQPGMGGIGMKSSSNISSQQKTSKKEFMLNIVYNF